MNAWKRLFAAGLAACTMMLSFAGCANGAGGRDQLAGPQKGDQIATIKVKDFGEMKAVLFPEVAPKGVENFVTHAEEGYYNNLTFHRIIEGFMAQGGDPKGDGSGGESIWGEGFGLEVSDNIRHYNGALAYAHSSLPDSNGSQFYIVDGTVYSVEEMKQYNDLYTQAGYEAPFPTDEEVLKKYAEYGGAPSLDGDYTVFGQVYEGMDVLGKIMAVEKDPEKLDSSGAPYVPLEPVVIESITISTYEG